MAGTDRYGKARCGAVWYVAERSGKQGVAGTVSWGKAWRVQVRRGLEWRGKITAGGFWHGGATHGTEWLGWAGMVGLFGRGKAWMGTDGYGMAGTVRYVAIRLGQSCSGMAGMSW